MWYFIILIPDLSPFSHRKSFFWRPKQFHDLLAFLSSLTPPLSQPSSLERLQKPSIRLRREAKPAMLCTNCSNCTNCRNCTKCTNCTNGTHCTFFHAFSNIRSQVKRNKSYWQFLQNLAILTNPKSSVEVKSQKLTTWFSLKSQCPISIFNFQF